MVEHLSEKIKLLSVAGAVVGTLGTLMAGLHYTQYGDTLSLALAGTAAAIDVTSVIALITLNTTADRGYLNGQLGGATNSIRRRSRKRKMRLSA